MKKLNLSFCLALLVLGAFGIVGCSGGEDTQTTQADIDQVNKGLPPTDPNPPPVPTRDGAKTGKAK